MVAVSDRTKQYPMDARINGFQDEGLKSGVEVVVWHMVDSEVEEWSVKPRFDLQSSKLYDEAKLMAGADVEIVKLDWLGESREPGKSLRMMSEISVCGIIRTYQSLS